MATYSSMAREELVAALREIGEADIKPRQAPPHLDTSAKRKALTVAIGEELKRRGILHQVLETDLSSESRNSLSYFLFDLRFSPTALVCENCKKIDYHAGDLPEPVKCVTCGSPLLPDLTVSRSNRARLIFVAICAFGAAALIPTALQLEKLGVPGFLVGAFMIAGVLFALISLSYVTLAIGPFGLGLKWLTRQYIPKSTPTWHLDLPLRAQLFREARVSIVVLTVVAILSLLFGVFRRFLGV
jgi:hypothetical protein